MIKFKPKYRVKEVVYSKNVSVFIPEVKRWWHGWYPLCEYPTLSRALDAISYMTYVPKEVIHEVPD